MSRGRTPATHRGSAPPKGTVTLEEAARLPAFADKSEMTVRRKLAEARVGFWQPDGSKGVFAIYDRSRAEAIGSAQTTPTGRSTPRPDDDAPPRAPRNAPDGWATASEIKLLLREHGIDGTHFSARWLRERLLELGVPADKRVVTIRVEWIFPVPQAVAALKDDRLVKARVGP